jgi:hypothetical protein
MGSYKDNLSGSLRCSFCGKGKNDVAKLIAGTQSHICNECVNVCIEIFIMEAQQNFASLPDALPSLSEVSDFLLHSERFRFAPGTTANAPKHL